MDIDSLGNLKFNFPSLLINKGKIINQPDKSYLLKIQTEYYREKLANWEILYPNCEFGDSKK